ncbi:MAG: HD domain-containing protein [Phycisphaeraceae bacterium]|nr:HD domain-containing protein [Phycisphaeraceae bacterium]
MPSPSAGPAHASRQRRFISAFGPSERVSGAFAISNAQLGKTKQDKPFLKCLISDRTGVLPARMWSIEPSQFRRLPTDGFVYIEAETQPYQGELQLIIQSIDAIEPTHEQLIELMPTTTRNIDEMFEELRSILGTLRHPAAKALATEYLNDEHLMASFKKCPAAKSMHHAYLGGLLEHTLTLLQIADRVCPLYPRVSRDTVILGLFLHDLAKTRELVFDRTFAYTDRGELIGHIVEGAIMLHDKAQQVMRNQGVRLPRNLVMVLQHIILSHHGVPEFGAAKVPATPEAIMINLIDNLDAKTVMALSAARPELAAADSGDQTGAALNGNFTERQWGLDTKLFRPDPLAD